MFKACIDELATRFEGQFDVVAGVEARGFLLASALAYATGTGVMTVRKAGKLPRETYREEYALEYGSAAIEIHCNDFAPGTRVLLLDDLLGDWRYPGGCRKAGGACEPEGRRRRRSSGTGMARFPDKYWPVIDLLLRATCLGVPAATISPPKTPGTWTNVNQIIRLPHGIFIVFHYNESIAPNHAYFSDWQSDGHCPSGEDRLTAHLGYRGHQIGWNQSGLPSEYADFPHLKGFLLNETGSDS